MGVSSTTEADSGFLTGMRGVAALLVFVYHSGGMGLRGFGQTGDSFVESGRLGVVIFFVVSAYCLCLVTGEGWVGGPVDWRAFYIRRVFRIIPLYFFMLAVSVANKSARGLLPPDLVQSAISHVTFFNIIDVAHNNDLWLGEWTISVEFAFYALFPLVLRLARWARLGMVLIALLLANNELRGVVGYLLWPDNGSPDHTLTWYFFPFALGMAAYVVTRRFQVDRIVAEVLCAIFGVTLVWTMTHIDPQRTDILIGLATSGLIVGCNNPRTLLARLLRSRVLAFLGTISFSIYLLHGTVLGFVPHDTLGGAAALAITVGLATLAYRTIEVPFRNWGRALAQRSVGAATAKASA